MKLLLTALLVFILMGCEVTSDNQLSIKQEAIMREANAQVGMPAIKNFQERKLMKMILELRDQENLECYAYLFSEQTGQLHFIGKCIGFGIPYSTQYTNPMRALKNTETEMSGNATINQADPNGLFMPSSAEGTWLMMVNPKTGAPQPCYFEPRVVVSPFELVLQ
jgi:hypothetical protein